MLNSISAYNYNQNTVRFGARKGFGLKSLQRDINEALKYGAGIGIKFKNKKNVEFVATGVVDANSVKGSPFYAKEFGQKIHYRNLSGYYVEHSPEGLRWSPGPAGFPNYNIHVNSQNYCVTHEDTGRVLLNSIKGLPKGQLK